MSNKPPKHVNRRLTEDERQRHAKIRAAAEHDFPPQVQTKPECSRSGIPTKIRQARVARGLTWYALAQAAGIASSGTVRDIEAGKDVKLSDLQAAATVLGLQLELVEQVA